MRFLPDGKFLQGRIPDAACNTGRNHAVHTVLPDPRSSVKFFRLPVAEVPEKPVYPIHHTVYRKAACPHRYPHNNAPDAGPASLAQKHSRHTWTYDLRCTLPTPVQVPTDLRFRSQAHSFCSQCPSESACVPAPGNFHMSHHAPKGPVRYPKNAHLPTDRYPLPQILPQGFESV